MRLPTGHFLRSGRQGERTVLRRQARPGKALDLETVGLRSADEHALHAENEPLKRSDLDEFVECYHPAKRHRRKPT